MAIPTPTEYGPVQTQGSQSTAIDTQTEGSLAVFVQQPVDQSPSIDSSQTTVVEEWKGAYSDICDFAELSSNIGSTRSQIVTGPRWVSRFSCPLDPTKLFLDQIDVRQLEAGDHAILRLIYHTETGGGETPTEVPGSEVWNLSWQSYSVSPYAFCANLSADNVKYAGEQGAGAADVNSTAYAQHIKDCIQQPADSGQQLKRFYNYMNTTTGGKILTLNAMERAIMDKVLADQNATYHFPVLTKTVTYTAKQASLNFSQTVGENIDVKSTSLPTGCPYTFDQRWKEWLKVGDQVSLTREVNGSNGTINYYTRTQTWWGAAKFDDNFYVAPQNGWDTRGPINGRWIIGKQ